MALALQCLAQSVQVPAEGVEPAHGFMEHPTESEVSVKFSFDSLYVSEGRDNLDGKGLFGAAMECAWGPLSCGAWYGSDTGSDYDEMNLHAAYTVLLRDWEVSLAYNHLEFLADNASDEEIGLGIAFKGFAGNVVAHIDLYYSLEAAGTFCESVLSKEQALSDGMTLTSAVAMGFNLGYIAEGHDGANNGAVSLELSKAVGNRLSWSVYAAHSWAIDPQPEVNPDDELLSDSFYAGLTLSLGI